MEHNEVQKEDDIRPPEQFSYQEIASYPGHPGIKELLDLAEKSAENFIAIKKKIDENGFFGDVGTYSNYDDIGNVVGELVLSLQLLVDTDIVEEEFLETRITANCIKLLNQDTGLTHQKPEIKDIIKELLASQCVNED